MDIPAYQLTDSQRAAIEEAKKKAEVRAAIEEAKRKAEAQTEAAKLESEREDAAEGRAAQEQADAIEEARRRAEQQTQDAITQSQRDDSTGIIPDQTPIGIIPDETPIGISVVGHTRPRNPGGSNPITDTDMPPDPITDTDTTEGATIETQEYIVPEIRYDENGYPIGIFQGEDMIVDLSNVGGLLQEGAGVVDQIGEMDLTSWLDSMGVELNDITGSDEYSALNALMEQMAGGPTDEQIQDSIDYAAAIAGMTREEYQQYMGDLLSQTAAGVQGQQGFTDEQRDLYERGMRMDMRNMEAIAQRQIDNIQAQTGSTSRALYTADQTRMQIQDAQIRSRIGMAQQEFVRQQAQWEAANNTYQTMLQNGQITSSQYLQMVERQQSQALQGYATQLNTMMNENSQYLQMYQQEYENLVTHAEQIYRAANMEMGVTSEAIAQMEAMFGMELAGALQELQDEVSTMQLEDMQGGGIDGLTEAMGVIGTFLEIALLFI